MNRIYRIAEKRITNQRLAGAGWTVQQHSPMRASGVGTPELKIKPFTQ
jgi:hypothetical protein